MLYEKSPFKILSRTILKKQNLDGVTYMFCQFVYIIQTRFTFGILHKPATQNLCPLCENMIAQHFTVHF